MIAQDQFLCTYYCYTLTVKNMQKIFQFTIKMDCTCAKNGFSSLSCSDKVTNEKFDGHTLKYRDLYT